MLYDKDIREPLFDFLEDTFGKTRVFEEKRMGKSRADVVLVMEDGVCGVEIKSDADTYARLARQVKDYNRFYDKNFVAVGTRHAAHIEEHVPAWWGIITVEETPQGPDFYLLRKATDNPKMKLKHKLSLLWRPELAHLQEINNMPKYKAKSKAFVIEKIMEKVDPEILRGQICDELFERDYMLIEATIDEFKRQNR